MKYSPLIWSLNETERISDVLFKREKLFIILNLHIHSMYLCVSAEEKKEEKKEESDEESDDDMGFGLFD